MRGRRLTKSGSEVRPRIRREDHKRVVLFTNRNEDSVINAYSVIIRAFLDHDGKVKSEADRTSIQLSIKTFTLLQEQLEKFGTTADVLIFNLLSSSKDIFRGKRLF